MRQATNREKAAKIAEKDPFGPVDEQLDRSAASEAVNTAAMAQVVSLMYPTRHQCISLYMRGMGWHGRRQ